MDIPRRLTPFPRTCPLCGAKAAVFPRTTMNDESKRTLMNLKLPGEGLERNTFCPSCNSNPRERLLYLYLLHYTDVFTPTAPKLRVLVRGNAAQLARTVRRVSRVELAQEHMDGLFDVIVADRMLDRAENDREALKLLRDRLVPNGQLILSEAVSPVLPATLEDESMTTERRRLRAYGDSMRKRVFGADFETRIREARLIPQAFDWKASRSKFGGLRNRFALAPGQMLIICRRDAAAQNVPQ